MKHEPRLLVLSLLCLLSATTVSAQEGDGAFNHKPPAAWPDWFIAPSAFGVSVWIHSDERTLMGGAKPDHWEYRAQSSLKPEALVALVKDFAEGHHFATVDVIDPHQKIVTSELDDNNPESMLRAVRQHHNYMVAIEATDDGFELSLNQGAP